MWVKKASRSIRTTTGCAVWVAAKVCAERPGTKPWAAGWTGMGPRTSVRSRRCRARSRDFGASISRPSVGPAVVVVVQPVGGGASVHGPSVGVPVEVLDAQVEHRGQVADGVDDRGVPGAADGAGRRHGARADDDRPLVLAGGGDCRAQRVEGAQERGQLAWPVGGWAWVGDQHRVGDRPQPSPPDAEDEPTLVDEVGAAPAVAGEERVGERGGEGVDRGHDWAGGGSVSRRCPVVRVHRLAERADAPVVWCRGESRVPGVTPERP